MNIETSKKMLKVLGIINVVLGIVFVILGVLTAGLLLGLLTQSNTPNNYIKLVILLIIMGVISVIAGCFDIRASKDTLKIMPAWIFAIIGIIYSTINLLSSIVNKSISDPISLLSVIVSILLSVLTFLAANSILKKNDKR